MNRKIALFLGLIISVLSLSAQHNPKAVAALDLAHEAFNRAGGITADFTVNISNKKSKQSDSYNGKVWMKGRKFKYSSPDAEMWFDGRNQWVMNNGTDEVNLSNPSESELEAINPSVLFQIYNKGYVCKYAGEKSVKGKMIETVDLIPSKTKTDVSRITVQIDKKSHTLVSIFIQNKNQINQQILIQNYRSGLSHPDNLFVFNKKQYPKAEVIDLR